MTQASSGKSGRIAFRSSIGLCIDAVVSVTEQDKLSSVNGSRSVLLSTITRCLPWQRGRIFSANWWYCSSAQVASITHSTIFACSNFWKLRSIPKLSMVSVVSRIPAVSMKRKVTPPKFIVSSITSRVVPWMSLTIARSSFRRAFNRVDFPALVSPTMATGTPFFRALPTLNVSTRWLITCSIC